MIPRPRRHAGRPSDHAPLGPLNLAQTLQDALRGVGRDLRQGIRLERDRAMGRKQRKAKIAEGRP